MAELKIIAKVPENTIPFRCGERLMACIIKDGKLERCTEFFKTREAAKEWTTKNPEYKWKKQEA